MVSSFYRTILSGKSNPWSLSIRGALRLAEWPYAMAIALRNLRFDDPDRVQKLSVPVISVGNLTVGGTGKTPFVIHLAQWLDQWGRSPAVVARGYGSDSDGSSDEEKLIRRYCPGIAYVADSDRIQAGRIAAQELGADVIVLDDGFQHRRLHRDLDIVLIDATCPFGYGHLLPRGLLREPMKSLRRAHVVVMTRCDQVSPRALVNITRTLYRVAPPAVHLKCHHRVVAVEHLNGTKLDGDYNIRRVLAFAGVGHPNAFLSTVQRLGFDVVGTKWWPDHHKYTCDNIHGLLRSRRKDSFDALLTTEKDAVKLSVLDGLDALPIYVVRVAIDFLDDGDTMLRDVVQCILQTR